jgi:hypothetical protein
MGIQYLWTSESRVSSFIFHLGQRWEAPLMSPRLHMHGNGLAYQKYNQYAESGNDGVGKTLYTTAVGEGLWQIICHVQNHLTIGMVANYRVYPEGECPLPPLAPLS